MQKFTLSGPPEAEGLLLHACCWHPNKNDAGAVAALFAEDAVLVAPDGMLFGRQAIEKRYADTFQQSPITSFIGQRCQLNAIDIAGLVGRRMVEYSSKGRLVPCSSEATGQRFKFVTEMLEDPHVDPQRAPTTGPGS